MRDRALIFVFGLMLFPTVVWAAEIDEKIALQNQQAIELIADRGEFSLSGWDKDFIEIVGELTEGIQQAAGDSTLVITLNSGGSSSAEDKLEVRIPKGKDILFRSKSAKFLFKDFHAALTGSTESGDISVMSVNSEVSINSLAGNIKITDSSGDFDLNTVNGEIEIKNSTGGANLKTVSGDQNIDANLRIVSTGNVSGDTNFKLQIIEKLKLNNVNGASRVESAISAGASVQMQSVKGDLTLLVPEDTSAEFVLQTHDGGKVVNSFAEGASDPSQTQGDIGSFLLGTGTANVVMNTTQGDIRLAPQSSAELENQAEEFDWSSVDTSLLDFAYINPNYEILDYDQFYIKPPEIVFDPRWMEQFGDNPIYRKGIKREYARALMREIEDILVERTNLSFSEKRGENILVVIPKLIELYLDDPDIERTTEKFSVVPAGRAKLDLVIYSPKDQAVLGLIIDKRGTGRPGRSASVKTRSRNAGAFKRLFRDWTNEVIDVIEK